MRQAPNRAARRKALADRRIFNLALAKQDAREHAAQNKLLAEGVAAFEACYDPTVTEDEVINRMYWHLDGKLDTEALMAIYRDELEDDE